MQLLLVALENSLDVLCRKDVSMYCTQKKYYTE